MSRLYDDSLYRFDTPQTSYWEATAGDAKVNASPLSGDESCDVAIIGGGYTGLSSALHLARDYGTDVRVLEAGHFGWGASGRNGGFCCMGGTGLGSSGVIKTYGAKAARAYYRTQVDAVELVRHIAVDENIDIQMQGDGELDTAHTKRSYERLKLEHEALTRVLGIEAELFDAGEFRERFYDSAEQYGGMLVRPTFGLHPLRYCRGLAVAAARHGAVLHDGSEVIDWSKGDDGRHRLATRGGTLRARKVIYATNGFISENLRPEFSGYTLPIISAIIATRPLSDEERAAHHWHTEQPAANTRRILNYYRMLPDGRFLLGGRGHGRGEPSGQRQTFEELQRALGRIWPHWRDVEIEYQWLGLICFTGSLRSVIGQTEDDASVFYGYGYHGNGVANATWTGKKLAAWIGTGQSPPLPEIIQGLGKKFPMPQLRFKYLQLGIAFSGWLDRRGG